MVVGLAISVARAPFVLASPGELDPNFGNGGEVVTQLTSAARGLTVDSVGRVLVAAYGRVEHDSTLVPALVRYRGNGTPDESFGEHGLVRFASLLNPDLSALGMARSIETLEEAVGS